jgi:hypothetical protein
MCKKLLRRWKGFVADGALVLLFVVSLCIVVFWIDEFNVECSWVVGD